MKSGFRRLLSGGDRRSIADSQRVRALIERRPSRLKELAALTTDDDWLVTQRALDLLEKLVPANLCPRLGARWPGHPIPATTEIGVAGHAEVGCVRSIVQQSAASAGARDS